MKQRKVIRDKSTGLPKKYLSGVGGITRKRLARVVSRISALYREGKRIPQSLIDERIKLGRKKK